VTINHIAQKYGGGGHSQASWCKLEKIEQLPEFIADLDNLLK
jgi:nanoRNase/pAp phosphatase (c-di-AMP/oligoRNAs hydrolase)